jgi:hypothetical protein
MLIGCQVHWVNNNEIWMKLKVICKVPWQDVAIYLNWLEKVFPQGVHCGIYSKDIGSSWIYTRKIKNSLQEIMVFFIRKFGQKNLPYCFFAPISNLTKMSLWKSQFGPNHFD